MAVLPVSVQNALRKFGSDIRAARIRRRLPMQLMATRVSISRSTLARVERGDPGVCLGTYATILGRTWNRRAGCELGRRQQRSNWSKVGGATASQKSAIV